MAEKDKTAAPPAGAAFADWIPSAAKGGSGSSLDQILTSMTKGLKLKPGDKIPAEMMQAAMRFAEILDKQREDKAKSRDNNVLTSNATQPIVPSGPQKGGKNLLGDTSTMSNVSLSSDKARRAKAKHDPALVARMEEARACWADAAMAIKYGRRTLLWGPPGTGKSYIGTHGVENFYRVYMTLETPAAELRGHWVQGPKGMYWHDGPTTSAWRTGGRLQIEELDQSSGDSLSWLLGVLDDAPTAYVTLPNGERIFPEAGFSVVGTTNESPSMVPDNLRDRFEAILNIPFCNPAAFDAPWNDEDLCEAAKRALYLPDGKMKGIGGRQIGLRAFLAIDAMIGRGLNRMDAARLVFGKETAQTLETAINLAAIAA